MRKKGKWITLMLAVVFLVGCGGLQVQENYEVQLAYNLGTVTMAACAAIRPEYIPAAALARDAALALLDNADPADLGPVIGDTMALIQEISASPQVDKYAGQVRQASELIRGLIAVDWQVPEKYAKARAVVVAFLKGMKGVPL